MEKSSIVAAAVILGILAVVLTGVILFSMPAAPVIPKCPACSLTCPEPVVINNTVTEEIEVTPDYKQKVVDALLSEVSKDRDFRECDEDRYKADEISVKRVYDGFVLTEDNEDETSISNVSVKLNYDEGDCYRTFTCGLDSEQELSC
jgi:hypothetical protein